MRITSVFFDVGETIIDESREYGAWAGWLGVPRFTFSAVFGAVIARGQDHRETFQVFRPGFDLAAERERRAEAGQAEWFGKDDLYPDARPCQQALRDQGLQDGLAGNQIARAEQILHDLHLPVDMICTSDGWGVEKPAVAFFARLVAEAGHPRRRSCMWVTGSTTTSDPHKRLAWRPRGSGADLGVTSSMIPRR